jgi:hypothetical protein
VNTNISQNIFRSTIFKYIVAHYKLTSLVRPSPEKKGKMVAQYVEALRYKPEGSGIRFPIDSLGFFIYLILLTAL